jgi:ABC-type antimicrobial peptide transport system permease subunit
VGAQVANPPNAGSNTNQPTNFVLMSVASGPDHDTHVARLVRDLAHPPLCGSFNQCSVSTTSRPTDILNYTRVQRTPVALAAVLALLAIGVVTNLLVSSIRRRRRDLAILKTLGFTRRQVSGTVAWQATTLVTLAVAVGLPIGAAIGRSVWASFATNLAVQTNPYTPLRALIIAIPVALTIANLIAAIPGILASRLPPANVLRTL